MARSPTPAVSVPGIESTPFEFGGSVGIFSRIHQPLNIGPCLCNHQPHLRPVSITSTRYVYVTPDYLKASRSPRDDVFRDGGGEQSRRSADVRRASQPTKRRDLSLDTVLPFDIERQNPPRPDSLGGTLHAQEPTKD